MNARHTLAVTMVSAFVALGFSGPRWLSSSAPTAHALPYSADKTLTPRWPGSAIEANGLHRVGDFHLVASNGRAVSGADVAGHVYVASFFYTECRTLCPDLRVQLTRVHEAFAGDTSVMILSHSVMPERDDPARLAHYAVRNGVDGTQWTLLTGSRAELMRLARNAYFVELADTTGNTRGRLRHTETLVLVDRRGHIRGLYDGSLAYDVTQLIADITQLKKS
jgi:protein SCO1/2